MSAAAGGPGAAPAGSTPGWLTRVLRDQRVAFLAVGAFNTAFGFACFVGFDRLFSGLAPQWAAVVHNTATLLAAHVVSVLVAFVLHRTLVFRVTGQLWVDLARFELVNLTALGLNWVLLNLLTVWVGLPTVAAQAIVLAVIAATSFLGHKHVSFRRSASGERRG